MNGPSRADDSPLPAWRLEAELARERLRTAEVERLLAEAILERNALTYSTAWRATGPVRRAVAALPTSLRAGLRRGAKLFFAAPCELRSATPVLVESASPACDVSILIVSRDAAMTSRCIDRILAATGEVAHEILIADIAGDPEGRAALQRIADETSGTRLVSLGPERYSGEANNILAEQARGGLLCLLHPEAIVPAGWLSRLRLALSSQSRAGAVGPAFALPRAVDASGHAVDDQGLLTPLTRRESGMARVDHLSAAALLLPRNLFLEVGGFDLAFEPGSYEDVDLSFRIAALGAELWTCPEVIVALEQTDDAGAMAELNRKKFVARWGHALRRTAKPRRRVLVFSPYHLRPGGGERHILTLAAALSRDHEVVFASTAPYSRIRLRTMGEQLDLDLSGFSVAGLNDLDGQPPWDLMVAMGNEVVPPIAARARRNLFLCQFPFPLPPGVVPAASHYAGYDGVMVYSDFVRRELRVALRAAGLAEPPIRVVPPPVPQMHGRARAKKPMILSVGRFFTTAHNKRHDLLIQAFAELRRRHGGDISLHLAGSLSLGREHLDHFRMLQELAKDLPVVFHVDCSAETLAGLYRDAALYWHGTGLAVDLEVHPEKAEHFGIAIAEAMSAQCVTFALDAGGAPEIITDGRDGFLYKDAESLVEASRRILAPHRLEDRIRIGEAAGLRAQAFSTEAFSEQIRAIAKEPSPRRGNGPVAALSRAAVPAQPA